MIRKFMLYSAAIAVQNNDNAALVPEIWVFEALATLKSNMVMGNLVHRDFDSAIAAYGDVVNASRPSDFKGKRKTDQDDIVLQDAISPNIPVPLDQHVHVSFIIKDGELSKAAPDLIQRYLEPAARELAEKVDQIVCGQAVRLNGNSSGALRRMTKNNADDYVLETNTVLDQNRVPMSGRNLVLGPLAQKAALGADLFVSAEKRGDEGTALRDASLGRVYGLDSYMDQNISAPLLGPSDYNTGVISGPHPAGYTSTIPTTVSYASVTVGNYVDIGGQPYRVTVVTDNSGDATITLDRPLVESVAASDPIVHYLAAAVDGTKAAGWSKEVDLNGYTANKHPQVGQWVTFGTGANSHSYTVLDVEIVSTTSCKVLLDRPLVAQITNSAPVFVGPTGGFNLAFHRNAVALVVRPLARVPSQAGAVSFVGSYEGVSLRITMQYNSIKQGMVVTLDLLCGVAILDERQAVVMYS